MGESGGKRNRQQKGNDRDGSNQKRRTEHKEKSDGDLVVFRVLCPGKLVGSVIGKSGKVINSIRQETHAKIQVVDPFPGSDLRVVLVYCYVKDKDSMHFDEDGDDTEPLCPAHAAVLKVQNAIAAARAKDADSDDDDKEEAQLLIPASQAATVIGKSGATIKKLRSKSKAHIRINPKDPSNPAHSCAMSFDNFLVITGDDEAVTKALFLISAIMCKFSPREEISLDTTVPDVPPSIIIPSDVPMYPAGGFYHGGEVVVPPSGAVPPVIGATSHMGELPSYGDVGAWPGYQSALHPVAGYGGPAKSDELVVKVLCPGDRIGRVIGKAGSTIKSIRQSTGARIDVDDSKKGKEECLITVTTTESSDDVKSAAVEAVLMLQGKINDEDDEKVIMRLLVPSKVIGCLIGKSGAIINDIRKTTKAYITISKGEKPRFASSEDELVEVNGEMERVRDALLQIIIRLRDDVLRDREGAKEAAPAEPVYSSSVPVPSVMSSIPPASSYGYDQRMDSGSGMGLLTGGSLYGYSSFQGGDSGYGTGNISSYSSKPYGGGLPPYELVIPTSAINKVLGKGGSNLANIRKISGASIDIAESKSSRSERIARISGTQDQMRSAENLIHAFMMST